MLLAGGIAEAADVRAALDAGADAAVAGTRFVMSDECRARHAYKQRLMESRETVLTELFGVGWPQRPAARDLERGVRALADRRPARTAVGPGGRSAPLSVLPQAALEPLVPHQRPELPLFGPYAPTAGGPRNLLDAGALYAGETVARLHDVRPAGELVRELAG